MNGVFYISLLISFAVLVLLLFCFIKKIPGFKIYDAKIIKTKNNLYLLSLTLSFKGDARSYLNPVIYIKTKTKGVYKAPYCSGKDILKDANIRETEVSVKNDGVLNYCSGIFTLNVFYPVEPCSGDKYFIHSQSVNGKVKVIRLNVKIDIMKSL
jgi:hypothetical protein